MKTTKFAFPALCVLFLVACSGGDDEPTGSGENGIFPNYQVIHAASDDSKISWYISDFFTKDRLWAPEVTYYDRLRPSMYELTQYPNQEATPAQKAAAEELIQESFDVAMRNGWFDIEEGFNDGFEKLFGDRVHFVNKDFFYDGDTLNPEKPEVLMYYKTDEGDFLMGVMYLAIGERGPQVGGPLTVWHFHIDRGMCYELGVLPVARRLDDGSCRAGMPEPRSPEMLHVWFFDHPEGRFATQMGLPPDILKMGVKQIQALQGARD